MTDNETVWKPVPLISREKVYISLAVGLILYVILILTRDGSFWPVDYGMALISLAGVGYLILSEIIGHWRHRLMPGWPKAQKLIVELGFEKEQLNRDQYRGLIGVHDGFVSRVYFDWDNSKVKARHDKAYVVLTYFQPLIDDKGEVDVDALDKLNMSIERSKLNLEDIHTSVECMYIMTVKGSYFNLSMKRYRKILADQRAFLRSRRLVAIETARVNELISRDPYMNGPPIFTFHPQD